MLKNLLYNKVFKNASWLIFGNIMQMIVSLLVGIFSVRYLGPSNYGIINYANAYTAFFLSVATLGINSIIVAEIVKNPDKEGEIIGTALLLRTIASFFSVLSIFAIVSVIDRNEFETIIIVILVSMGIIFNALDILRYWFQAKLKSKVVAISSLIAYIVTAIYRIYLMASSKSIYYFAIASSIDYLVIGILLFMVFKKQSGVQLVFSMKRAKILLEKGRHFILPGLMVAIYAQTDKLMLKQMINSTEIGYYSTALTICNMWCFVLSAVIDSMYPTIIESYKKDKISFERQNKILYAIIFYLSVAVSLFITLFADIIIKILYGKVYLPAADPLRIITWYTSFSYLGVARNAWIVAKDKQKYLIYTYAISAVFNVILNLMLIPNFGAKGAALASLIAQIISVISPLAIKELRENTFLIIDGVLLKGILKR